MDDTRLLEVLASQYAMVASQLVIETLRKVSEGIGDGFDPEKVGAALAYVIHTCPDEVREAFESVLRHLDANPEVEPPREN